MKNNLITRLRMSIADARKMEDMRAKIEQSEAKLEYVAMMADVEIPTEKEESYVSENQEVV